VVEVIEALSLCGVSKPFNSDVEEDVGAEDAVLGCILLGNRSRGQSMISWRWVGTYRSFHSHKSEGYNAGSRI
jgi:hypothetical protein